MFFVQFEATPRKTARTASEAAGAYINCWIERSTLPEAVRVAREAIAAEGWITDEPEEAYEVDSNTYPPGKDGRAYFLQALTDKEVFVFYTHPEVDRSPAGE
jgi:hypothetical protein